MVLQHGIIAVKRYYNKTKLTCVGVSLAITLKCKILRTTTVYQFPPEERRAIICTHNVPNIDSSKWIITHAWPFNDYHNEPSWKWCALARQFGFLQPIYASTRNWGRGARGIPTLNDLTDRTRTRGIRNKVWRRGGEYRDEGSPDEIERDHEGCTTDRWIDLVKNSSAM